MSRKIVLLVLLSAAILSAQAEGLHLSTGDLNLPGRHLVEKSEIYINHRFFGNAGDDAFNTFLGMDAGANIVVGFGFRLNNRMDLSVLRSPIDKEYYLAGKISLLENLVLLLGDAQKTAPFVSGDRNRFIGQLIFEKEIVRDKITFSLVPTISNPRNNNATFALGCAAGYSMDVKAGYLENLELIAEYVPVLSGYAQQYSTCAFGVKAQTWGHFFSLLFTNSTQVMPDGYISGNSDNIYHFGFNILRKF